MQRKGLTTLRSLKGRWPLSLNTSAKEIGPKASALNHIVQSIAVETNHPRSPTVSTSSIWHDAILLYISQLPDRDQQSIMSTKDDSALTLKSIETLIAPLMAKHKHGVVMRLLVKLGTTLQHVRSFATVVDVAVQSHPNVACLIWGGVRLILQISCKTLELFAKVSELFERLSTHLPIFEKWATLFPRAEYKELSESLTKTYLEYIGVLVNMIRFLRGSGLGNMARTAFSPSFQHQFKESESRIESITKVVELEVHTAGIVSSMRRDQEISRLLGSVVDRTPTLLSFSLPIQFLQVMPRNDRYYERGSVMDQIAAFLAAQDSRLSSVALHGIVGCGKSSIAAEYVHRSLKLYGAIMCFDARDSLKLEMQFVQVARRLGFASQGEDSNTLRKLVMDWLSTTDLKWLIVFDDADHRTTLRAFWPVATHGAIIVTSRDPLVQDEGLATNAIRIQHFDKRDGADFLLSFLERPDSAAAEDRAAADQITEHFSGWPKGLRITAAFIQSKRLTPAGFVRLYNEQKKKNQQLSLLKSSTIGVSILDLTLSDISCDTLELLDRLSLLDPSGIPVNFVDTPTFQYLDARAWLSSRSVVAYDESSEFISMDRYFQGVWLEKLMKTRDRYHSVLERVMVSLLEAVPEPDLERPRDPGLWKVTEMYISHVSFLEKRSRMHMASFHICHLLSLFVRCIHYFFEVGEYQRGFDHVATAESMIQQYDVTNPSVLSRLYYVHGRLATETSQAHLSIRLFDRALFYLKQDLATDEIQLLDGRKSYLSRLYSCLGNALTAADRFDEAEKYHQSALITAPKADESRSSTRIGSLYANLGSCLLWQGKYAEAEDLLRKALVRHDRGLECSLYALGNVYLRQGKLESAFDVHRRVLESFSTTLGHFHHTVADSCHKVGSIYALHDFKYRDMQQAESFLRKALDIYRLMRVNGKDFMGPSIARTEWKLAKIIQLSRSPLDADAALMEMRSLSYLENTADSKDGLPQDDDQIEQALDKMVFFWSR